MRELEVRATWGPDDEDIVGTLVEDGREIWFAWDPGYRQDGPELGPYAFPLRREGLVRHRVRAGIPIPGFLGDARPDG